MHFIEVLVHSCFTTSSLRHNHIACVFLPRYKQQSVTFDDSTGASYGTTIQPGVLVRQTKDGEKKYTSRLKVSGGKEIHLGIFDTEAEAVLTRAIAAFLCRNNKDGYLDLLDDCYYAGVPPVDDEQRYFVIPPLAETPEGEKNGAVKKRSKQIYIDFKKRKEDRSFLLELEQSFMVEAEGHVGGHFEAGPSGLVNDQAPDSATFVMLDNVGAANQLCLVDPTNSTPTMHLHEASGTPMNGSQDSWRTDGPQSQVPSSEEASPISAPAPLSNSIAPSVNREASFLQLVFSYQQENQELNRALFSCQEEIRELKRRNLELETQVAERLSCCSEENRPTKKKR